MIPSKEVTILKHSDDNVVGNIQQAILVGTVLSAVSTNHCKLTDKLLVKPMTHRGTVSAKLIEPLHHNGRPPSDHPLRDLVLTVTPLFGRSGPLVW